MRESDIGDGGVEKFHEGGEGDNDRDDPRVDGAAGFRDSREGEGGSAHWNVPRNRMGI